MLKPEHLDIIVYGGCPKARKDGEREKDKEKQKAYRHNMRQGR
jgi:hypothetical protein